MKRKCECEEKKGFHFSASIDITKIVKYLCVTLSILAVISLIMEAGKNLMLEDE